jgi:hypothetical protein
MMEDVPATAPWCMAADPDTRRPRIVLPPGSCDTHAHICGPIATYRYADERIYTAGCDVAELSADARYAGGGTGGSDAA